ncbi:MAG: hypothetical protein JNM90_11205 [Burkholderiales bacterium]|nr:hypothetical protein [Burkholderiales bacterium]
MLNRLYLIAGLAALAYFSYAQHQGMSPFAQRAAPQAASGSGGGSAWRSGSLSHK